VNSHLTIPSMEVLVTPSFDRRNFEMKLKSTVHDLDESTVAIKSQFCISQFQWSYFLPLQVTSRETPKWSRRSRSHLDLMAAIKSRFHISQFQWSYFLPLQVTSRETPKWSRRSRSHLDLTAVIKSQFHISRFQWLYFLPLQVVSHKTSKWSLGSTVPINT
jgi:hypothetical protein